MSRWKAVAAFVLLCTATVNAQDAKFHPATDGGIGLARYRVAIDFSTAADPDGLVRQLLATCRCRQELYAELGFEGMMIVATPAAAELLSRDPRVESVYEIPPPATIEPPAVSSPVNETPDDRSPMTNATVTAPSVVSVASPATEATVFWNRSYSYDKSGNLVSAGSDRYAYDRLGRITYADAGTGKKQEYTYDRYGNLQTIIENGNTAAPVDLRPDALTNRISSTGNVIARYDSAGRMTSATGLIAKYDGEDTVVESSIVNATTVRRVHLYTAAGERVATLTVNASGQELWSGWTIRDPNGKPLRRFSRTNGSSWRWDEDYIYRDGQLLAAEVDTAARTLHYHLDHLGTPRVITGNGGAVIGQHTYHAFGQEATDPNQEAEALKFTGHERDANSLDYMHARYYIPTWGRFLTVDPMVGHSVEPQAWNRYSYVLNRAMNYIDPTGLLADMPTRFEPNAPCPPGAVEPCFTFSTQTLAEYLNSISRDLDAEHYAERKFGRRPPPLQGAVNIGEFWEGCVEAPLLPLVVSGGAIVGGAVVTAAGGILTWTGVTMAIPTGGISLIVAAAGGATMAGGVYLMTFGASVNINHFNGTFGTHVPAPSDRWPKLFPQYPAPHEAHGGSMPCH